MFNHNPSGNYPKVDSTCYIHPTAIIIGNVEVGKNVFIGPGAIIRADELKSSIIIKDNCNIQDRVIIHALANTSVLVEEDTSLAHGCIIHGPCKIGRNCFIGFNSVIFQSQIQEKSFIKHSVVVEDANICTGKKVESNQIINNNNIKDLKNIDKKDEEFMKNVVKTNLSLVKGYKS